jgi:hypothetical protein
MKRIATGFSRVVMAGVVGVLLFSCFSNADIYEFGFDGDVYLWDMSGTYDEEAMGLDVSYTLVQDDLGKLTGSGYVSGELEGADVYLNYAITGSVKQKANVATVVLNIVFNGTIEYYGDVYYMTIREKGTFEVDSDALSLSGIVKVRVSVKGEGSMGDTVPVDLDMPDDMDGTSILSINVDSLNNKLNGTGSIVLSNSDVINFSVGGTYNLKKNQTKLALKGIAGSLAITVDESDGEYLLVKGKVMGQTVKVTGQ